MSDLTEPLARVMAATGPDRELDAAITVALFPRESTDEDLIYASEVRREDHCAPGTYWIKQRSGASLRTAEPITGSIDAALALVERVLPGWACGFDRGPETCIAFVDPHDFAKRLGGARYTATAPTAPLAIIAALLAIRNRPVTKS